MPDSSEASSFVLQVDLGEDFDQDQLDQTTRQLKLELQDLDVESIDLVHTQKSPEGTKSAEAFTLGALAVAVLPTAIPKLIEYLQAWTMRSEGRSVKIKSQVGDKTIELEYSPKGISNQDLKELVTLLAGSMASEKDSPEEDSSKKE